MNNAIDNALEAIRHANPVPDPVDLADAMLRSEVFLTATKETSMSIETDQSTHETPAPKQSGRRRNLPVLMGALAVAVVVVVGAAALLASEDGNDAAPAAPGEDPASIAPAAGPITLKTMVDLGEAPIRGTFEVTAGADVLGCSSGTVVYTAISETSGNNVMTCESGPNVGTFTIRYSRDTFKWSVPESAGDFAGLQGEGRFEFVLTSTSTVVETFTGDIEYTP